MPGHRSPVMRDVEDDQRPGLEYFAHRVPEVRGAAKVQHVHLADVGKALEDAPRSCLAEVAHDLVQGSGVDRHLSLPCY